MVSSLEVLRNPEHVFFSDAVSELMDVRQPPITGQRCMCIDDGNSLTRLLYMDYVGQGVLFWGLVRVTMPSFVNDMSVGMVAANNKHPGSFRLSNMGGIRLHNKRLDDGAGFDSILLGRLLECGSLYCDSWHEVA